MSCLLTQVSDVVIRPWCGSAVGGCCGTVDNPGTCLVSNCVSTNAGPRGLADFVESFRPYINAENIVAVEEFGGLWRQGMTSTLVGQAEGTTLGASYHGTGHNANSEH